MTNMEDYMDRDMKQEVHMYCKNREERKKRYDNKRKYDRNDRGDNYSSKTRKIKKEWK